MEHGSGMERIIEVFEKGWVAGSCLQVVQSDEQFATVEPHLYDFWIDGFHAAQASLPGRCVIESGTAETALGDIGAQRVKLDRSSCPIAHSIGNILGSAYSTPQTEWSDAAVTALLAKLDRFAGLADVASKRPLAEASPI